MKSFAVLVIRVGGYSSCNLIIEDVPDEVGEAEITEWLKKMGYTFESPYPCKTYSIVELKDNRNIHSRNLFEIIKYDDFSLGTHGNLARVEKVIKIVSGDIRDLEVVR